MRTRAAVLWEAGGDWSVEDVELGAPHRGEVTVALTASGLCHSDEHVRTGDTPVPFPLIGGHEGAGVITEVGPEVRGLAVGDHVILSFLPACGQCPPCAAGRQNLCDDGANAVTGTSISDGSFRVRARGQDAVQMCLLGTFSPFVTVHQHSVVKIEDDIPLDVAALLGCGVTTGWASATRAADVRAGETVVVIGVGGVGINAVQGAAVAGAKRVVAVDPVAFKREQALAFGATHAFASIEEATAAVLDLSWGRMAEKAIVTVGRIRGEDVQDALGIVGKGGRVVVTGMGASTDIDVKLDLFSLTLLHKDLQGAIFGGASPRVEIPWLLSMYREGRLRLDGLATRRYRLDDVNQGYQDMRDGLNLRGLITFDDEPAG